MKNKQQGKKYFFFSDSIAAWINGSCMWEGMDVPEVINSHAYIIGKCINKKQKPKFKITVEEINV